MENRYIEYQYLIDNLLLMLLIEKKYKIKKFPLEIFFFSTTNFIFLNSFFLFLFK